jgi:hypothetical protein
VGLTNVVLLAAPPKLTSDAATKLLPLIVSVKDAPPAKAVVGEIVVIFGLGLAAVRVELFEGVATEAVPPPHPASNTVPTISRMASPRNCAALLFMMPP